MKQAVRLLLITSLFFATFTITASAENYTKQNQQVEKAITKAMSTFQVPGVAVAIIKNDQVVFSKGFGVIESGKKAKVNSETLFGIASNTKAMTTALIAGLVDEGKLTWRTKVIDIIPEFQMPDAYVTREFTIIDLLSHNSGLGLGAGDLTIWPDTTLTTKDVINALKHLPQTSSFRSEFAYDNLMYVIAGDVIARVTGKSWQENIEQRIFKKLGMKNTKSAFSKISKNNKNVARAHVHLAGELNVIGGNFIENFSSAGSVASSVNDMSLWLKAQLKQGVYIEATESNKSSEKRLFSEEQSRAMWQARTLLSVSQAAQLNDKTHFYAYGLGWFMNDYHGVKLIHHSGGILGMVSKVVMVPEENLAMVVLTNQQSGYAFNAIYRQILNEYMDLPEKDWTDYYYAKQKKRLVNERKRLADDAASIDKDSTPSLPLANYAQTYVDNWYGEIHITQAQDKLIMQFSNTPVLKGTLEHYQYNTFIVRWYDKTLEADAFVNFNLNPDGSINYATMKAVSTLTDFSFDFHDLRLVPKQ